MNFSIYGNKLGVTCKLPPPFPPLPPHTFDAHTHTHYSLHSQLLSQLPALGHCISVLLDTLHTYQSKAVRRATLQTLLALTRADAEEMVESLGIDLIPMQASAMLFLLHKFMEFCIASSKCLGGLIPRSTGVASFPGLLE